MQFSTIKYAVAALAVYSSGVLSQITPAQVVDNIRAVTTKSQALQAPAQSINVLNGPLLVVGLGPFPPIIAGFADIVTTATAAIVQMQGMAPVPAGRQSDLIFEAFREFVRVHQVLLNILIGKAGLFNTVPIIGQPVAAILRQIEAVVDTIALGLINNVQSRANDLQDEAKKLSGSITLSIDAYDGLNL
ncbi:UVI-1 protein [Colletotrichum tofieldiae]|uniref:UVI-1 protein n=1 Tax=Colletotrichum tofieldiae TaxID=708197 RepID=A0A166REY1_9PEZI|nr:UVI-1 protein [Colletotrichum tofieldiae]GKT86138.1 UVI-1 protein [Colletotrichum tofieldiae]